jgi:hypothetical protein
MIFAAQEQARRKGKKTIFKSRGRERSGADVEHYWSRKKEKPTDFSPIPNTPDGLEYWTPIPSPGDTTTSMVLPKDVLIPDDIDPKSSHHDRQLSTTESSRIVENLNEAEDTAESSTDDTMSIDMDLEPFREYGPHPCRSPSPSAVAGMFLRVAYRCIIAGRQSTTLRPLDSPDTLRHQEHTLNCSREYFQWWIEKVHRSGTNDWNRTSRAISKLGDAGLDLLSAIDFGHSKDHIEIKFLDLIAMLPSVLHQENPKTILAIMDVLEAAVHFRQEMSPQVVTFRDKVLDQALRLWGKDHPSTRLVKAISQPDASFFALVCALLPGKDLIGKEPDLTYTLVPFMLATLSNVAAARGEHTESLQYAKELYEADLARYQERMSDWDLLHSFDSLQTIIHIHIRRGNYDQANELVEDGLEQLIGFHDEILRNKSRVMLLHCFGELAWRKKPFTVALDAYQEALSLCLRMYGVGSYRTTQYAAWVRYLQGLVDQESPL